MWSIWVVEPLLLVSFAAILIMMERTAAMRGAKGNALPDWANRALRVYFLFIIALPFVLVSTWFAVPFLVYLPSYVSLAELKGGRPAANAWVRTWRVWKWLGGYLSLRLVKTADLDPRGTYVFGLHPHGILPFGTIVNMVTDVSGFRELFPGVNPRGLAASFCFYVPLYRDLILSGMVCDAARYSAKRLLDSGHSLFLVPGGATEALHAVPHRDVLVLRKRKGFVRLAIAHGASLVPVFSFNENNTYDQVSDEGRPWLRSFKTKFQRIFGISLPLIRNVIPRRTRITTVVGAPIKVKQVADPPADLVEKTLATYIKAVEDLYAEHGPKFNEPRDKQLVIL